jgi:hypothetical protein
LEVLCGSCNATLKLNPKLAGMTTSCPQCGVEIVVPLELEPDDPHEPPVELPPPPHVPEAPDFDLGEAPKKKLKPPARYTLWLLGAQSTLAILGLTCVLGAFFHRRWQPPEWSYFRENEILLLLVGVGLLLGGWLAHYLPVLTTLGVAILVMCVCAHNFVLHDEVDASRMLALAMAMLALFLALQHRRALSR